MEAGASEKHREAVNAAQSGSKVEGPDLLGSRLIQDTQGVDILGVCTTEAKSWQAL